MLEGEINVRCGTGWKVEWCGKVWTLKAKEEEEEGCALLISLSAWQGMEACGGRDVG